VEAAFYLTFPLWALLMHRLSRLALLPTLPALWLLYVVVVRNPAYISTDFFFLLVFLLGLVLGRLLILGPPVPRVVGLYGPPCACAAIYVIAAQPYVSIAQAAALLLPCYLLLIWSLVPAIGIGRQLALQPLVTLGEASYGLYILHWPLLEWFTHATGRVFGYPAGADAQAWPLFVAYLLGAVAISVLCYRHIESPARRWLRGCLSGGLATKEHARHAATNAVAVAAD
jgi:peptidoglycan/LPS O-acetylase OafA/YrhL